MNHYLLSTYAVDGEVPGAPTTPQEVQAFMARVAAVEAEMDAQGAFVFSGGLQLQGSDTATAIQVRDGKVVQTNGAFAVSDTQIAGFYIINADDFDAALAWGSKVAEATNHTIEVRPFRATGRLKV